MSQAACKVTTDSTQELTQEPGVCLEVILRTLAAGPLRIDIAEFADPANPDHDVWKPFNETVCDRQMSFERQEWLRSIYYWMSGTERKPTWPG